MTEPDDEYRVGYGRPPKQSQFEKGRSGNPGGRPKKRVSTELDLAALLKPVTVTIDGQARVMQPKEIELRQLLEKATKKENLKAIAYLLELFAAHGAIEPPKGEQVGFVVTLPNDVPRDVARKAFETLGLPPWKARKLAPIKAAYLATRSEADRIHDEIIGYEL